MRKLSILLSLVALLLMLVVTASASAYLHVANATNYAAAHSWSTFCSSSYSLCPSYPWGTGWYDRGSDSYVRVEIMVRRYDNVYCHRVFAVRGSDASPYISGAESAQYWSC